MLISLTPDQENAIEKYYNYYLAIGLNSDPVSVDICKPFINTIYAEISLAEPEIILAASPLHAIAIIQSDPKHANTKNINDLDGNHSAPWIGFIDFFHRECGIDLGENTEIFIAYRDLIKNCGWCYLFEKVAIICQRPTFKHTGTGDRLLLHNPSGPAIFFPGTEPTDECNIWALNDVVMPPEYVLTPAEKLDPKIALNEKNADIQRELIRKIGYEKILKACNAATLEKWVCPKTRLSYTMKEMKFGDISRRYCCYEHASMPGIFYAKAVPPEVSTCLQMRVFQTCEKPDEMRKGFSDGKFTESELIEMLPETVQ